MPLGGAGLQERGGEKGAPP